MARALVIQLARLGDLLQTLPVITALRERDPRMTLDLLCPASLTEVGRLLPGVSTVLPWDGAAWQHRAGAAATGLEAGHVIDADRHVTSLARVPYDRAYVLNQHPRALLAGTLLARTVTGPLLHGPLDEQLTPWAEYVREVARTRRGRRVHLADAFCGLCGVSPPGRTVSIVSPLASLPVDLEPVGQGGGPWAGVIVGAGDAERLVPVEVWQRWVTVFLNRAPGGRVILLGAERERGQRIQDALAPSSLGRIWDATSRTSLTQLAAILLRCHTVIGADTGPLHMAAALGTKVIGWYFARARVHETGPYGPHHLVWQAGQSSDGAFAQPGQWPIEETVAAILNQPIGSVAGWSLWTSHCDRWGAYYSEAGHQPVPPPERETLWRELQPSFG